MTALDWRAGDDGDTRALAHPSDAEMRAGAADVTAEVWFAEARGRWAVVVTVTRWMSTPDDARELAQILADAAEGET